MWRFISPQIVFGKDSVEFLERFGDRRCLIVTDEIIDKLGYCSLVSKYLKNYKVTAMKPEEPSIDDAFKLADELREMNPEIIIALGGGSVIDVAKTGRILMEADIKPEQITPFTDLGEYGYKGETALVAIPTTSGTGSEATWAIVLKDRKEGRKVVMANEKAMPEYAIVDPAYVYSMPESLVALTGFDALSHAVEAYLSSFSNPFSDALAIYAISEILDNFSKSYMGDVDARERMHISATMAGIAFSNSQVGIVHALAHSTGGLLGIPHGLAVAVFLNPVLEFCRERGVERLNELVLRIDSDIITDIERFEKQFGIAEWMCDLEIEKHGDEIVRRAMEDSCIVTGPFVPDESDLVEIIERVVKRCMRKKFSE